METITIVDYQLGNMRSVEKTFKALGSNVEISSDPTVILNATKLVLPGVGHFGISNEARYTISISTIV